MKILFLKSLVLTYWQPSSFVTGHPREFLRELSRINLFCIAISINNVKVIQIIIVTIVFYGSTRIRHSIKILNNFSCIQTSNFQDIYFLYIKLFHRALHFEKLRRTRCLRPWVTKSFTETEIEMNFVAKSSCRLRFATFIFIHYIPIMTSINFEISTCSNLLYKILMFIFFKSHLNYVHISVCICETLV